MLVPSSLQIPFRDVGCAGTCVPGSSAGRVVFPSEKLAAQVFGVRIDWFEVLEVLEGECCLDNWVGVGTIIHPEMLASLCAVFPSDELAAQVLLVCLYIGWFEVLELLEGERCLDRCVSDYIHPEMLAYLCAHRLVLL